MCVCVCVCVRLNQDERVRIWRVGEYFHLQIWFGAFCWSLRGSDIVCFLCYTVLVQPEESFWKSMNVIVIFHWFDASVARQYMLFTLAFISTTHTVSAFNFDSSQASVACGHDAQVKDDLLLVVFNGTVIACSTLLSCLTSSHPVCPSKVHLIAARIKGIFHPENTLTFLYTMNL